MFKLGSRARNFIWNTFVQWLARDRNTDHIPISDFDRLRYELSLIMFCFRPKNDYRYAGKILNNIIYQH